MSDPTVEDNLPIPVIDEQAIIDAFVPVVGKVVDLNTKKLRLELNHVFDNGEIYWLYIDGADRYETNRLRRLFGSYEPPNPGSGSNGSVAYLCWPCCKINRWGIKCC